MIKDNGSGRPASPIGRYLVYAIGEIVLVVIGILIALQINNWNEHKKEEAATVVYVNNLIEDIKQDTLMYANQIKAAQIKFQFSKEINEYINEGKAITDTSAFIINLQSIARLLLPAINDNTYNDLVSTGNMKLIRDKKSIDAIKNYYSNQPSWWYTDYKNQLVNGYLPLAVDAIPMHLHEEILGNEIVTNFQDFQDEALLTNKVEHFTKNDVTMIMNALKGSKEFAFQLKRITRSHLVQVKLLGLSKNSAISLLDKLKEWQQMNTN
jgi:hypothetical protein